MKSFFILIAVSICYSQLLYGQGGSMSWDTVLQQKRVANQPAFKVTNPDYKKSPKTGMTREHWKQMALYLLRGHLAMSTISTIPCSFPASRARAIPGKLRRFLLKNSKV
ncbi:hypothetical protein [Niabella hibiscisoli]|uniref:hypothetical protein n=1 Tax=Niabella hibiscisoli TaxID=1825928 RepID=UPI001F0FB03A|nr:hypothetical protein [Niabella hibiscisoli]MCH5716460.1 hypothetical protein [Niabella hibiscisoli]